MLPRLVDFFKHFAVPFGLQRDASFYKLLFQDCQKAPAFVLMVEQFNQIGVSFFVSFLFPAHLSPVFFRVDVRRGVAFLVHAEVFNVCANFMCANFRDVEIRLIGSVQNH